SNTWIIILVAVLGGAAIALFALGTIAISGVRRYLASAKTSEAKNTIGAISRGARSSYERELPDGDHKLCASAIAVPAAVPAGRKYQPASPGSDFDTGDALTGWKCLRFAMTQPIYFQYNYHQGSGYLGTSPGPDGFEAAAQGDLDGDGDTSLF